MAWGLMITWQLVVSEKSLYHISGHFHGRKMITQHQMLGSAIFDFFKTNPASLLFDSDSRSLIIVVARNAHISWIILGSTLEKLGCGLTWIYTCPTWHVAFYPGRPIWMSMHQKFKRNRCPERGVNVPKHWGKNWQWHTYEWLMNRGSYTCQNCIIGACQWPLIEATSPSYMLFTTQSVCILQMLP